MYNCIEYIKNKILDIIIFVIGLLLYIENVKLIRYAKFDILGPKFFPNIITISIMILSIISFIIPKKDNKNTEQIALEYRRILIFGFVTIIYIYALTQYLGFLTCSIVYLTIISCLFSKKFVLKEMLTSFSFSVIVSWSVFYFFERIMKYPLP